MIRLALHIHGEQLHVVRGHLREQGGGPDMNHRDVEACLCVVQRLALDLDGDSQAALDVDGRSPPELVIVHLDALGVPGHRQVPTVREHPVVGEPEETLGHGLHSQQSGHFLDEASEAMNARTLGYSPSPPLRVRARSEVFHGLVSLCACTMGL
jgi:hypothetical protein